MSSWEERVQHRYHSPRDYLDAARAEDADGELLAGLASLPYAFTKEAVAEHRNTRPETLVALVPDTIHGWGEYRLLRMIVSHPAANAEVWAMARERVYESLTAGYRPFCLAITLARRGDLTPEDVHALGRLPGASARLRRGLRRAM